MSRPLVLILNDAAKNFHKALVHPTWSGDAELDAERLFFTFLRDTIGNETSMVSQWLSNTPKYEKNNRFSEWLVANRGFVEATFQVKH